MYRCESWTVKKTECWRIDAFELWCWRRLWRVPWTARRSNQSILKEISPEYSLEGLVLKLKLQSFGHLIRRTDSFEKTLMLGKIKGERRTGWQRMRRLDGITDSMDTSLHGSRSRCAAVHGVANSLTQLSDLTDLNCVSCVCVCVHATCTHSAMSEFLWSWGLYPSRLPCPWGVSRQEYWSGLPCSPPGDLPEPEIEPKSPALQVDSLPPSHWGSPLVYLTTV